jgi:N,N-dimethylformamidase beta subunit-like, C-terminal
VNRLPFLAFGALVAATVGAFFVTQHLKVTTPLIAGFPAPDPSTINPVSGTTCGGTDYRGTMISFYLLYRTDDVDVFVVDQSGAIVRTVAVGRHMRRGVRKPDGVFYWNGREDNGSVAPDGTYHFRIALLQQGRTVDLTSEPVRVKTTPPRPVVVGVSPSLIPQRRTAVTIRYAGNENRGGTVRIYRTDLAGGPRLVKSFPTPWRGQTASWDGTVAHGRPAPAGTYLVGLDVTDAACETGHFPVVMPPPPGTTPHAGVTVRYLAGQPPPGPVTASTRGLAYVDSRRAPYRWSLLRAGSPKPLESGQSSAVALRVPIPGRQSGLYELALRVPSHGTAVPLVATGRTRARALVVLPALTWQGLNPVDDTGDGLPSTLAAGGPIALARPFANGLPPGFADEQALLAYLDGAHRPYELTTDLALAEGAGPPLAGHATVVLAGDEHWLPASVGTALRGYVQGGGHVLSLGIDSLRRTVTLESGQAIDPTAPAATDVLGARPGQLVTHNHDLLLTIDDGLGIFSGTSGALSGFGSYQPIAPPGQPLSEAGTSSSSAAIVGYALGKGTVVEIGLPGFGSSLAHNVDAKQLMDRVWTVLGR